MPPFRVITAAFAGVSVFLAASSSQDDQEVKFADAPAAVRKTFEAEINGAKVATLTKQKDEDDGEISYWADVTLGDRVYAVGVLEDGTLTEMNLAVDDDDIPFDGLPKAVRDTFKAEAFGAGIDHVGKDLKYGVAIYEASVDHKGKLYEIVVAEDGTLVEKVLVIEDEDIDLSKCPAAVQATLKEHAKGGTIQDITRSTGIGRPSYEAEVEIHGKVYLIEVGEKGLLITKSLEAEGE